MRWLDPTIRFLSSEIVVRVAERMLGRIGPIWPPMTAVVSYFANAPDWLTLGLPVVVAAILILTFTIIDERRKLRDEREHLAEHRRMGSSMGPMGGWVLTDDEE
ncbi:MAG: hypothetical protein OXG95_00290 [Chloroflexi bacterium]|nr:hypothetical protein [Chloroflexota bacterium]